MADRCSGLEPLKDAVMTRINSSADWASTIGCCISDDEDEIKNDSPAVIMMNQSNSEEKLEHEKSDRSTESILQAAQKNEVGLVQELLKKDLMLVHAVDSDFYTPLHRACYSNHIEVIKVLLSHGANVCAKTCDEREPLHCACQWDCVEAASLLLQNGANVNASTSGKLTPLHLASANPKARRTLELLLWHSYITITLRSDANDLAYDTARRSSPYASLFEILEESINIY